MKGSEGNEAISPCSTNQGKGGFRASSFIFCLLAFENMGFVANMASLVLYFHYQLHFDLSGSANTLTNFMGSTFLLSIVGGFISDTFITRLHTCIIFGLLELLAYVLMIIQARYTSLQPDACGKSSCMKGGMAVLFYTSLCLLALGSGGVRGALPALGADQFDQKNPKEAKALASYFNWLMLSTTAGACVGVTVIVWVSQNRGWWKGFLICIMVASLGFFILALGKSFYRLQIPGDGPLIRVAQVIVVAIRNRKLLLPDSPEELYELSEKESDLAEGRLAHTNQFRCLDKAAILSKGNSSTNSSGWIVCTVTQVEEVKVLTRMVPIIASTIIMNTCLAQLQTFSIQQGSTMDLHLGSFLVPAASIPVIPLAFMTILIPIYEFVFVPFAKTITHHPNGITQLQRVGVGLVLSVVSMAVAGIVEVKRRHRSLSNPLKPISLFWLSFQFGIFGIADMFTLVGLLEFFYKEAPVGMRSLSTSFTWISLSFGYFLSSIFVEIINSVTKRLAPSKHGWLQGETLNNINLNLFYWFLAILSALNFVNYLYWASWYKYKTEDSDTSNVPETESATATSLPSIKEENREDDHEVLPKSTTVSEAPSVEGQAGADKDTTE